jgi:hypothetical protein
MTTVPHVGASFCRMAGFIACMTLGSACSDATPGDPKSSAERVCAECTPIEPGQASTAASTSLSGCARAYLERNIDQAEAEMLGFPVSGAVALIEKPIDTPMHWVPKITEGGGPASGYEPETRIRGAFEVESYDYRWLDPARCDGTLCNIEGELPSEQAPCLEQYISIRVSGNLETLDGAIAAEFPSQVVNLRQPGQTDDVVVAAAADLSQARGTLVIDPGAPPPRLGRLDLSLQFADSQRRGYGVLSVNVTPDWDNLAEDARPGVLGRYAYYAPLEGQWGDVPSGGKPNVSSR